MLARRNLCWYASATLRTARRAGVRPHSSARETPGESSQPAPASSGNCGTWNSELGDGALPKHVPKFLRDAMQGLDPQLVSFMLAALAMSASIERLAALFVAATHTQSATQHTILDRSIDIRSIAASYCSAANLRAFDTTLLPTSRRSALAVCVCVTCVYVCLVFCVSRVN